MKIKLTAFLLLFALYLNATTYYVSLTGSDSNNGLTTATAWRTLAFAVGKLSPVAAGDIVYVKAGNYGPESVVFYRSGNPRKKLSVIGYKTNPGDQPPLVIDQSNPYAAVVTTDMPSYVKTTALDYIYPFLLADVSDIIIKNIQVSGWRFGFTIQNKTKAFKNNIEFFNCCVKQGGDATDNYAGWGFNCGSMGTDYANYCKITKCLIVNVGAEAINLSGNHNYVADTKIYNNDANRQTDYYVLVTGDYNEFYRVWMQSDTALTGNRHGLSFKTNAEQIQDKAVPVVTDTIPARYNKAYDCTAISLGEGFAVRHRGAQWNEFHNCKAYGSYVSARPDPFIRGNGITIRDGASYNIFDRCYAQDCESGIRFSDTVEDDTLAGHSGNNNIITNMITAHCLIGVYFDPDGMASDAGRNTLINCTFANTRYLLYAGRHCTLMKYINCVFNGTLPSTPGGAFRASTYSSDVVATQFDHCDFWNIQGGMPSGFVAATTAGLANDPYFISPTLPYNFRLISYSTIRNAGLDPNWKDKKYILLKKDYYDSPRPVGDHISIGATEGQ